MDLNYLNELTTTNSQLLVISIYAIIVGMLLWAIGKDPKVEKAFIWYLMFRHVVTFAAFLTCSFLLFALISLFFIALTCIDVGNFYKEPSGVKNNELKLPIIELKVSRKPIFQLFIFFLLDIVAWLITMTLSDLFPSSTVWHRISF